MDIKDIIKWLIPCLMVMLRIDKSNFRNLRLFCFVFLLMISKSDGLNNKTMSISNKNDFVKDVSDVIDNWTLSVNSLTNMMDNFNKKNIVDLSDYFPYNLTKDHSLYEPDGERVSKGYEVARTFGRPLKKLSMALVPLAFQAGVAATWMFVSTLLSLKSVLIGAAVLKLLLIAGAAKIGTLFAHKSPPAPVHHQPWSPGKEVHLHIHNTQPPETHSHTYEEHGSPSWSRDGSPVLLTAAGPAPQQPYSPYAGPQTINTPYGSYVRVGPPVGGITHRKR